MGAEQIDTPSPPGNVSAQVVTKAKVVSLTRIPTGGASTDLVPPPAPGHEFFRQLYDVSGALQTCVAAYIANIETNGHTLHSTISLEADDAYELVAQALYEQRLIDSDADDNLDDDDGMEPDLPTPEEVATTTQRLRGRIVRERLRADMFLRSAGGLLAWTELRRQRREDLEIYGCAYWEVLRDPDQAPELDDNGRVIRQARPVRLTRVHPRTLRATKPGAAVPIYQRVRTSLVGIEQRLTTAAFRRYCQTCDSKITWYRQLGDPRLMSSATGKYYTAGETLEENLALMAVDEPDAQPASEVVAFSIGEAPYGQPRWFGEVQTALGLRRSQEANVVLLGRGGIPAVAVVVSGGSLRDDATKVLQNWAERDLTGPEAQNKLLIIQADGPDDKTKVTIERLSGEQKDGMYLEYIALSYDLIGRAFRLPKLLCGDASDVNRATAEAALDFAECQVFGAERRVFDEWLTKFLCDEFDIRFWDFRSNPARLSNASSRATMVNEAVKAGWMVPAEARRHGPEIFDQEFQVLDADWTKQPLALTLSGIPLGDTTSLDDSVDTDNTPEGDEVAEAAKAALRRLRGDPA